MTYIYELAIDLSPTYVQLMVLTSDVVLNLDSYSYLQFLWLKTQLRDEIS